MVDSDNDCIGKGKETILPMKRNRQLSNFGQQVVRQSEAYDRAENRRVRTRLRNIETYTKGLIVQIGDRFLLGEEGFNYEAFEDNSRMFIIALDEYAQTQYDEISARVNAVSKRIYLMYRKELTGTLRRGGMRIQNKTVEEALNVAFGGKPTDSFLRHVKKQLQVGRDPAALIKTISQEHVRLIQREMLLAVSKGKGFGWARDKVVKEMTTAAVDTSIRNTMEYNVTRIARTSFMSAVNADATEMAFDNSDIFYGSRRVADGRPCIACVAQDGRFYKPGEIMVDHPNGMCMLVPLPYPDEYFETGKITSPINDPFDRPLAEKFYKMSAVEQRAVFANDSLYRLWRKEQFDLEKAVVGKFGNPISYQQAALNLDVIGGMSAPRVTFVTESTKDTLLKIMDPKDRLDGRRTVTFTVPKANTNSYGINLIGDGTDFIASKLPNARKARIAALYGEERTLPWYTFNARARLLGIYTRKATNRRRYFSIPTSKY